MNELLPVFMGLILRVGLPIGLTALIILLLKRLDAQWQAEAPLPEVLAPTGAPCWERHQCPPEKRAACKAFQNTSIPCWQLHRKDDGTLREGCIGCTVFREAPIPTLS